MCVNIVKTILSINATGWKDMKEWEVSTQHNYSFVFRRDKYNKRELHAVVGF